MRCESGNMVEFRFYNAVAGVIKWPMSVIRLSKHSFIARRMGYRVIQLYQLCVRMVLYWVDEWKDKYTIKPESIREILHLGDFRMPYNKILDKFFPPALQCIQQQNIPMRE